MGTPREPKPVKPFVALLSNHESLFPSVEGDLRSIFGSIDSVSETFPWQVTDYYENEMGPRLLRRFVSFEPLTLPERLPEIKLRTQDLEGNYQWFEGGKRGRRVNIDPGYLETSKVVLASTKDASHRIYLCSGIYGEVTLRFESGHFQPLAHTYPDYRWQETLSFFAAMRSLYLSQLKHSV